MGAILMKRKIVKNCDSCKMWNNVCGKEMDGAISVIYVDIIYSFLTLFQI